MSPGDIVIAEFPFTNLQQTKVQPAVVVTITEDKFEDVVLCMISSNVSVTPTARELFLSPSLTNGLRAPSVIKIDRIATIEQSRLISTIGKLSLEELNQFISAFHSLVSVHE